LADTPSYPLASYQGLLSDTSTSYQKLLSVGSSCPLGTRYSWLIQSLIHCLHWSLPFQ